MIRNPKTGRMVKIDGKIGKSILQLDREVKGTVGSLGEGLPNFLSKYIRKGPSPEVRKNLASYGGIKIIDVSVCRRPLEKLLTMIAKALTLGKIEEHLKKYGYDNLYHLFLLLKMENGITLLVDKQEVVNAKVVPDNYYEQGQECKKLKVNDSITLNQLFEGGYKIFDNEHKGENFWLYDAFTNNCQIFVNALLKGTSGKISYSEEDKKYVMQNVGMVIKKTDLISKVASVLTDLGALKNRIIYGKGLKKLEKHFQ
jgi:hypothetical protein